jgi:hypothetical protein
MCYAIKSHWQEGHCKQTYLILLYNAMLAALGDIKENEKIEYEAKKKGKEENKLLNIKFLPPSVKSVMLHRVSITNYMPISDPIYLNHADNNKNGRYLAKNLRYPCWETIFTDDNGGSKTWTTLGRFDATSMTEVKLPCKCYLQGFQEEQLLPFEGEACLNEVFSPHFSRREIARPVEIIPEDQSKHTLYQMFSMLSVTLQRRSIRLDFLYRMIRALSGNYLKHFKSGLETEIINLRDNHVFVQGFLTDGWGDILFKFSKMISNNEEVGLTEADINTFAKMKKWQFFRFFRAITY